MTSSPAQVRASPATVRITANPVRVFPPGLVAHSTSWGSNVVERCTGGVGGMEQPASDRKAAPNTHVFIILPQNNSTLRSSRILTALRVRISTPLKVVQETSSQLLHRTRYVSQAHTCPSACQRSSLPPPQEKELRASAQDKRILAQWGQHAGNKGQHERTEDQRQQFVARGGDL